MATYCPIGSNFKQWPTFSLDNLVSVGPATIVNPNYLQVYGTQAASASPGVEVLDIGTINKVGLVIIATFHNSSVYRTGTVENFNRTIGFCISDSPTSVGYSYGFYWGHNVYFGGNTHIWHGNQASPTGITPYNFTSGPIDLTLKMEVLNRTWDSIFGWYYTIRSTAYVLGGSTYTSTQNYIGDIGYNKICLFNGGGSNWDSSNYAELTDLFIYSPYLVGGAPCPGMIITDFTSDITTAEIGEVVTFTDLTGGLNPTTTWDWDFGDSSHSDIQNPTHSWSTEGYKTVSLTATSIDGNDTKTVTDYATIYMSYDLIASQVGTTNEVSLTWNAAPEATSYTLERDTSPTFSAPVSFSTPTPDYSDHVPSVGTYYYRVRSDLALMWSSTAEVATITLSVDFVGTPTIHEVPFTAQFTDMSTPAEVITAWEWDFGDGSPISTDQNPTHLYSELGTFTVTLTVYSGIYQATETKIDYITVDLNPIFAAYPLSGPINTNVNFVNGTIGDIDSWEWDFGDGSPISTDKNPSHIYEVPGKYTVSLVATKGSESRTETKSNYITINIQADFTGSPLEIQAGTPVNFVDTSDYQADTWTWNFGDGSPISHEQNPIHTYNTSGTFTVSLSITKGSVSDLESKPNYVSVGLVSDFTATPLKVTVNEGVFFTDLSVGGAVAWDWDFGDGSPHSYLQNPVHSYASPGYYTVELRITTGSEIGAIIKEHYIHVTYEDSGTGFVREQGPTLIFD